MKIKWKTFGIIKIDIELKLKQKRMEEKIENTFLIILWLIFDTENFYIIQNWNYTNYYSSIDFLLTDSNIQSFFREFFLFFQIKSLKLRPLTKKFSIIPSISL